MKVFVSGHELDGAAIDPMQLTFQEAIDVEDATGMTFDEFQASLGRGSLKGLRALLWVALRRSTPELKLGDVNPKMVDFTVQPDDPEEAEASVADPTSAPAGEAPAQAVEPVSDQSELEQPAAI